MKKEIKRLLRLMASRLPAGAQDALVDGIVTSSDPWRVLERASRACGLSGVEVEGDYGRIVSSAWDQHILRAYARSGRWASRTNGLLTSFFGSRPGQYVDVGANIGLTTIPVARATNTACLAIEPEPTNFDHLVRNVRANCPTGNVECLNAAVMDRTDSLELELAPGNLGDHRVRVSSAPRGLLGEDEWRTIRVEGRILDEVVPLSRGPLAVKIDTQGAEPYVFAGGRETLSRADLVILEWSPYWMRRMNADPSVVPQLLEGAFRKVSIAEGEEGPIPESQPAESCGRRLLELYDEFRENPLRYFDVIASK